MRNDLTILYVEDEPEIRKFMYKSLSRIFEHVLFATNGLEGLELFKTNHIDIVITIISNTIVAQLNS
jgi:CheY-like chemotaxis protein